MLAELAQLQVYSQCSGAQVWGTGARPVEPRFGFSYAVLSAGRTCLGLVHRPGSAKPESGGRGWVALCKQMILCPLNHTLFTIAQVSEQLFSLPSIFKMLWTLHIWIPKGMPSELSSPKMPQVVIYALTATCLKHLLTFLPIHSRIIEDVFLFLNTETKLSLKHYYPSEKTIPLCVWQQPTLSQPGDSGVV